MSNLANFYLSKKASRRLRNTDLDNIVDEHDKSGSFCLNEFEFGSFLIRFNSF